MQYGLIIALVALAIVAGVSRVGNGLDSTFCKIHQALEPHAVCAQQASVR